MWVIAIENYAKVYRYVLPKKERFQVGEFKNKHLIFVKINRLFQKLCSSSHYIVCNNLFVSY